MTREDNRRELAAQLRLEPEQLHDGVSLVNDLALDSLGKMVIITWLESRGVAIGSDHLALSTVDDVLKLLDVLPTGGRAGLVLTDPVDGRIVGWQPPPGQGAADVPAITTATLASPLLPVLATRVFRLTPVEPGDIPYLFSLAVEPQTCFRWRYRGVPPAVEQFAAELWAGVLIHFVVRRVATDEPVGYVVAYQADLGRGHAYLGAVYGAQHVGTGLPAQATAVFMRYLFHTFPFRKVYLDVPGWNWNQLASAADTLFEVEGVLREHDYYAGRHWDKRICAVYRDRVVADGPLPG